MHRQTQRGTFKPGIGWGGSMGSVPIPVSVTSGASALKEVGSGFRAAAVSIYAGRAGRVKWWYDLVLVLALILALGLGRPIIGGLVVEVTILGDFGVLCAPATAKTTVPVTVGLGKEVAGRAWCIWMA